MSATTESRTRPAAQFGLRPVEAVLVRRTIREVWRLTRWIWPVAALVAVALVAVIANLTPITRSAWEVGGQWPRWWLFALGIAQVAMQLPITVLHGVTRRSALRACGAVWVVVAVAWAAYMSAGHVLEQVLYDRLGWSYALQSPHLFDDGFDVPPMLFEYGSIFLAYLLSGGLVGGLYYRHGGVRGTLLLPLGLLPVLAIEALLSTGWYGALLQQELSLGRFAPWVLLSGVLAVLALTWLAVRAVLHDVPIRPQT